MNKTIKIIVAIALMIGAIFGAQLKIDTTWHYFGTGVSFGVGLSLLICTLMKSKA